MEDPRFSSEIARHKHIEEGRVLIRPVLRSRSTEEWLKILKAHGVPVQAVRELGQALSDPQLDHRGLLVEAGKLDDTSEPVTLLGAPFVANEDGPHQKAEPPFQVGQHSREVLEELGFSALEITKCLETAP